MKPMLAHIYEPHRVTYPVYVQPKLNGIRALYQNGHFQSRDQLPFPNGLLDHLAKPLLEVFSPDAILDGELYVHGWPLQRINAAVTPVRLQPTEDTVKVQYHIFDRAEYSLPFWNRYVSITSFLTERLMGKVEMVSTSLVNNQAEADKTYAMCVDMGYEGQMYRLGDCPYTTPKQPNDCSTAFGRRGRLRFLSDQDNRTWHLLKRKDWQDDEFICVDMAEGEGKLQGTLGAVICQTKSNNRFSVGSGLSDSERQHYWSNPPIGRLVKVKYLCLSDAGIPLNPTILCIL